MTDIESRLAAQGLSLPDAPAPAANYVSCVIVGDLAFMAGQLPMEKGALAVKGHLGVNVSIEEGQRAARLCALNLLAQLKTALGGDLSRARRCVKLTGFVACSPDFDQQPLVMNGASDLMVAAMGDAGRHARAAVGAPSLPRGAAVEVEAVFQIV